MKKVVVMKAVKSQGTGAWDSDKEIGTLRENLDKADILSLSDKNIDGDAHHVSLFVKNGEGVPNMIYCTKPLSKKVRKLIEKMRADKEDKKKIHLTVLKGLLDLKLANLDIETDEGPVTQTFIIAPGTQGASFSLATLEKGEVVAFEDLIA